MRVASPQESGNSDGRSAPTYGQGSGKYSSYCSITETIWGAVDIDYLNAVTDSGVYIFSEYDSHDVVSPVRKQELSDQFELSSFHMLER